MDLSASECSSGCESGWTVYFNEEPSNSNSTTVGYNNCGGGKGGGYYGAINDDDEQEGDEDLSMVSDASSGPPHYLHEYRNCGFGFGFGSNQCYYEGFDYKYSVSCEDERKNKKKTSVKDKQQHKKNLCLDDTASSPFFHFAEDNVGNENHESVENVYGFSSQVYPAEHFEEESKSKKQMGFFKSSKKGKSGNLLGRKRQ